MKAVSYGRARDLSGVKDALAEPGTALIAGGTEQLNWMRLGISAPTRLLDLQELPHTYPDIAPGTRTEDGWLHIGALSTLNQLEDDVQVRQHATVLSQACLKAASAQVRNRATLAGNVLQKTRCGFFRAEEPLPWACNKRTPGSGCAARHGLNDQHAVFGWTDDCIATQPSDPAVALVALDAVVELTGPHGDRAVEVANFFLTQADAERDHPGEGATRENVLEPGELITSFRVPVRPGTSSAYVKVRERESYAYALASAAVALSVEDGVVTSAAIALGSVAQRPWRLPAAEAALLLPVSDLSVERVTAAVHAATEDANPVADSAYKLTIARTAAVRAFLSAAGTTS